MKKDYEATIKKDNGIFATLEVQYTIEHSSIIWGMNIKLHEIIKDFSIDPANISSIQITRDGLNRKVEIKYTNFDLSAITSLEDKKQQIREILNLLGYSQEKIESISYEKKLPNVESSTEMIWIANIYEHYDPDESFSQKDHEYSMSTKISKALGFEVKVSMS